MFENLYPQVRAVLGLDTFDLKDQKLEEWGIKDDLEIDLGYWFPDYEEKAKDSKPLKVRLRSYAKYYCASTCIKVGATYIVKVWTDGETKFERFEGDWETLAADFKAAADRIKLSIQTLLGQVTDTDDTGLVLAASATPDRDPVTTPRDS